MRVSLSGDGNARNCPGLSTILVGAALVSIRLSESSSDTATDVNLAALVKHAPWSLGYIPNFPPKGLNNLA